MPVSVDLAQQQWKEGYRRLGDEADPRATRQLHAQVEIVTRELRRRIGGSYTIAQLAERYADADRWGAEVVEQESPAPGWERFVATATDAAFHLYARGARDYRP